MKKTFVIMSAIFIAMFAIIIVVTTIPEPYTKWGIAGVAAILFIIAAVTETVAPV